MSQQQTQPQANPKSLINQFYQRVKALSNPTYEVVPAPTDGQPTRFLCTLTLPAVNVEGEGEALPEQSFQEEGRSKKAAQDAAAATALRFLSEQPLYGAAKPYEASLLRTLATRVLSPQGLYRDPEIHGAAAAASAFLDGWLPLAALAHSRLLRGWAKEYGPAHSAAGGSAANDPAALVDLVRRELAAQAAAGVQPEEAAAGAAEDAAVEAQAQRQDPVLAAAKTEAAAASAASAAALGLSLGPSGLCVRLSAEAAEAAPPACVADQLDPAVASVGGVAALVVIPADSSLPLREECVPAHGSLLTSVAGLLGCPSPHHVLQWGRVGHKASYTADPRVAGRGRAAAVERDGSGGSDEAALAGGNPPDAWEEAAAGLTCAPGGSLTSLTAPPPQSGAPAAPEDTQALDSSLPDAGATLPPAVSRAGSTLSQQSISLPPLAKKHHRTHVDSSAAAAAAPAASESTAAAAAPTDAAEDAVMESAASDAGGDVVSPSAAAARGEVSSGGGSAEGGGGGGSGGPSRPPASAAAYRVDSTLTLAVHRGAAAMDWEADGQNEVRGPEHPAVSPTATTSGTPADNNTRRHSMAQRHGHVPSMPPPSAPVHNRKHARTATTAAAAVPGPGPSSAPSSKPASPRAGPGGVLPPVVLHPYSVTLPEPSLYSRLLLPPLPPMPASPTAAAAADPPPISATATAAAPYGTTAAPAFMAGEPINIRATWLAGRTVYGDAVATTCRQSPTPHVRKNHHVIKWRPYTPADFWRTAGSATPAAAYARALHAPLLLRGLPAEFRGPSSWPGPSPRQLLDSYTAAHAPAATAALELQVPDVDLPGEGYARMEGTNFLGLPYKVTAGPGPLDIAAQQAALAALLALQRLDGTCLAGPRSLEQLLAEQQPQQQQQQQEGDQQQGGREQEMQEQQEQGQGLGAGAAPLLGPSSSSGSVLGESAAELPAAGGEEGQQGAEGMEEEEVEVEVEVIEAGVAHARQPQDGALVKVAYTIYLPPQTASPPAGPADAAAGEAAACQQHASAPSNPNTSAGRAVGAGGPLANNPAPVPPADCEVVEQHPGFTFCVGGGRPGVPRQLDAVVRRLRVGGRARCRLQLVLDGVNPLGAAATANATTATAAATAATAAGCFRAVPGGAVLDVRLLHATLPVVEGRPHIAGGGGGPPLFNPPLGAQRMQAVAAALRREGAATLLDLGCGDAKLIEGLVLGRHGADCGGPLRRCVGVDISGGALVAGGRRLAKLTAAAAEVATLTLNGEESVPQPVEVTLYKGSAMSPQLAAQAEAGAQAEVEAMVEADPWVGLRGCDAAAMVEVVEHLDSEPLALVGPCVLGGLRPRLLLVTTPNWEYNALLRRCEALASAAAAAGRSRKVAAGAGGGGGAGANNGGVPGGGGAGAAGVPPGGVWPGPPGRDGLPLRCADHRFEWTRAEFQEWCGQLATTWGYDVSYEDIGAAIEERAALQGPGKGEEEAEEPLPPPPGSATQMALFRRRSGAPPGGSAGISTQADAAVQAQGARAGVGAGTGGVSGSWELAWGPAKVAAPREELEEAEEAVEAAGRGEGSAGAGARAGGGGGGGERRRSAPGKRHSDDVTAGPGAGAYGGGGGGTGEGGGATDGGEAATAADPDPQQQQQAVGMLTSMQSETREQGPSKRQALAAATYAIPIVTGSDGGGTDPGTGANGDPPAVAVAAAAGGAGGGGGVGGDDAWRTPQGRRCKATFLQSSFQLAPAHLSDIIYNFTACCDPEYCKRDKSVSSQAA